ncbi:MAG: RNA pyrophosphohydrolase [Methylomonas sp.]|nr:RNA pyrophosphohydrolase [Methylomonas sp.]PPD21547.1 MAG: RNA pyrophosphohydrolase [Methylomonas sp.]PPD26314.1 MAG: RNA pyrophosphohydrolase [Methylomonas sp.]PPD38030.1 MAG: RNA pyrophosphohydrolase [Methylomonas sp.]PPD40496.1 MAG: RNA pyrophosphohydrolase [Methylomonas sp.]
MIDSKGYRPNVGIILCNDDGRVFWAKRKGTNSWQFPQGGIDCNEEPEQAMYRELWEETGLRSEHVEVLGRTRYWLRYKLPERYIRKNSMPLCIGQKQIWFMLRLLSDESQVRFDCGQKQEFDNFKWVEYWYPLKDVVYFKRRVYKKAMDELGVLLAKDDGKINPESYLTGKSGFQ